jgi:hypothetical protein
MEEAIILLATVARTLADQARLTKVGPIKTSVPETSTVHTSSPVLSCPGITPSSLYGAGDPASLVTASRASD